jgi:hypothetical protein
MMPVLAFHPVRGDPDALVHELGHLAPLLPTSVWIAGQRIPLALRVRATSPSRWWLTLAGGPVHVDGDLRLRSRGGEEASLVFRGSATAGRQQAVAIVAALLAVVAARAEDEVSRRRQASIRRHPSHVRGG